VEIEGLVEKISVRGCMTAANVFEAEGRAAKVMTLCRQIDLELKGLDTTSGRLLAAEFLRNQEDSWWLELAKRAGVKTAITRNKVPGPKTRAAVVEEYETRARQAR
jgi:hypothetical protein